MFLVSVKSGMYWPINFIRNKGKVLHFRSNMALGGVRYYLIWCREPTIFSASLVMDRGFT